VLDEDPVLDALPGRMRRRLPRAGQRDRRGGHGLAGPQAARDAGRNLENLEPSSGSFASLDRGEAATEE